MDIITFLKENWIVALIGIIVLFFLIRAMFKLAIIALIIGAVLFFFFGYTPSEVFQLGKNTVDSATSFYEKTVEPILESELGKAEYTVNPDGSYIIQTENTKIVGTRGGKSVKIHYKDKVVEVDFEQLNGLVQNQIKVIEAEIDNQTAPIK